MFPCQTSTNVTDITTLLNKKATEKHQKNRLKEVYLPRFGAWFSFGPGCESWRTAGAGRLHWLLGVVLESREGRKKEGKKIYHCCLLRAGVSCNLIKNKRVKDCFIFDPLKNSLFASPNPYLSSEKSP